MITLIKELLHTFFLGGGGNVILFLFFLWQGVQRGGGVSALVVQEEPNYMSFKNTYLGSRQACRYRTCIAEFFLKLYIGFW